MNNDGHEDATDQPVSLNNESNPDAVVLPVPLLPPLTRSAAAGAGGASTIVPDAHIPPSGQKQHTKKFYAVKTKEMSNKEKVYTTLASDAPTDTLYDGSSLSPGFTVSNSPYSLINRNFPTNSSSTPKISKRQKR